MSGPDTATPSQAQTSRVSRPPLIALLSCLLVGQAFLAACSSTSPKDLQSGIKKAISGVDEQIFLEEGAEKQFFHPNVIIKRGEAFFEKEEYTEALIEYNRFLDLFRSHMLAPYAAFRIGEVHLKMAKSIDRDPEPIQKAIVAFERVRKEFPGSRYDAQVQQKIEECHNWLAQMHLFVGQFYYRRGSYLAAAHRFEQIIKTYPDRPVAPDALYFLAMSYHEMGADDWAQQSLVLLAEKYPDSQAAGDGKLLLAKIGGAKPSPLFAQQSDSSSVTGMQAPNLFSIPSAPQLGSLGVPSSGALDQAFTSCRLGAWC
jgi:outer membrane protein assembly factor BamD